MALTQISTAGVKDDAVTSGKIPANAVGSSELADDAVDTAAIVDNAVTGAKIADNLDLPDNNKIRFGTSNDLKIYHDGSNSYIEDGGTGALVLLTSTFALKNAANSKNIISGFEDGAVELYYDNSRKVQTNNNGLEVHGKLVLGNDDIPSGQISNYSLDVQGDGTNAYIDMGNVFPNFSAGQFPTARLKTVEANKTLEIHSMWGGDNVLYKHIELAGDKTKFFRGTDVNVEIGAFGTHGLTFNGDTAAANALDDYEEGTHETTVTMSGDTAFTYLSRNLAYTKIGRVVHLVGRINLTGAGGSSFEFTLPFACADGSPDYQYETSNEFQIIRGDDSRTFRIREGESVARIQSDGSAAYIGASDPHINVNLTYFTST